MGIVLKPIFDWLVDGYSLFDNVLYNYVAMVSVGIIAYIVAKRMVRNLYADSMISGRGIGSILHWVIRFITFVTIVSVVSLVFRVIKFIASIPLWGWAIALIVFIIGSILFFRIKKRFKNVESC